jgi:hypothetical protein
VKKEHGKDGNNGTNGKKTGKTLRSSVCSVISVFSVFSSCHPMAQTKRHWTLEHGMIEKHYV